jgi:hypothetical protein
MKTFFKEKGLLKTFYISLVFFLIGQCSILLSMQKEIDTNKNIQQSSKIEWWQQRTLSNLSDLCAKHCPEDLVFKPPRFQEDTLPVIISQVEFNELLDTFIASRWDNNPFGANNNWLNHDNLKKNEAEDGCNFTYARKIHLDSSDILILVGDIHGDIHRLLRDLLHMKNMGYLNDNLRLEKGVKLVFLGDYVDRVPYSVEVITIISLLWMANKDEGNVVLCRGNHEESSVAGGLGCCLYEELVEKKGFSNDFDDENSTLNKCLRWFSTLPAVVFLEFGKNNTILCCHAAPIAQYNARLLLDEQSTQFQKIKLSDICTRQNATDMDTYANPFCWTDICQGPLQDPCHAGRGKGPVSVTSGYLEKYMFDQGIKVIFRGHQDSGVACKLLRKGNGSSEEYQSDPENFETALNQQNCEKIRSTDGLSINTLNQLGFAPIITLTQRPERAGGVKDDCFLIVKNGQEGLSVRVVDSYHSNNKQNPQQDFQQQQQDFPAQFNQINMPQALVPYQLAPSAQSARYFSVQQFSEEDLIVKKNLSRNEDEMLDLILDSNQDRDRFRLSFQQHLTQGNVGDLGDYMLKILIDGFPVELESFAAPINKRMEYFRTLIDKGFDAACNEKSKHYVVSIDKYEYLRRLRQLGDQAAVANGLDNAEERILVIKCASNPLMVNVLYAPEIFWRILECGGDQVTWDLLNSLKFLFAQRKIKKFDLSHMVLKLINSDDDSTENILKLRRLLSRSVYGVQALVKIQHSYARRSHALNGLDLYQYIVKYLTINKPEIAVAQWQMCGFLSQHDYQMILDVMQNPLSCNIIMNQLFFK